MLELLQCREKARKNEGGPAKNCGHPKRGEHGKLLGTCVQMANKRLGTVRKTQVTHSRGWTRCSLNPVATATGCSTAGSMEEIGANLWEGYDEWPLRRTRARAWAASPVRKHGRKRSEHDCEHGLSMACRRADLSLTLSPSFRKATWAPHGLSTSTPAVKA